MRGGFTSRRAQFGRCVTIAAKVIWMCGLKMEKNTDTHTCLG